MLQDTIKQKLEEIKILKASTKEELEKIRIEYLGKKGLINDLFAQFKELPNEQKKDVGAILNELKNSIQQKIESLREAMAQKQEESKPKEDLTKPADLLSLGSIHPLTTVRKEIIDIFSHLGYTVAEGPEIEDDWHVFSALNFPPEHPARDMQDTLYLNDNILLRTHNTGITARMLERYQNCEFSYFTIGKVYRNDEDDQTHSHQFTQVDFASVGKHNIQSLIWTIKSLLSYVFEEEIEIRMRPSFFPFTEPSMEIDILYKNKWIEVLGAGMINEEVLRLAGYKEPSKYRGIAGGIGIERLAMIKYGIKDIREFFNNDLRMIKQFR